MGDVAPSSTQLLSHRLGAGLSCTQRDDCGLLHRRRQVLGSSNQRSARLRAQLLDPSWQ